MAAMAVELQGIARNDEVRRICAGVAEGVAQAREGIAQAAARLLVSGFSTEHSRGRAQVRPIRFDCQIGEAPAACRTLGR